MTGVRNVGSLAALSSPQEQHGSVGDRAGKLQVLCVEDRWNMVMA